MAGQEAAQPLKAAQAAEGIKGAINDAAYKIGQSVLGAQGILDVKKTGSAVLKNRAGESRSPYIRGHMNNPVAWQLWGDEAIALAREENKLLFLSIGYSACHWCHVMERESFQNDDVAALLNRDFIPVKIDREERPDIDRIYMNFVQATTGSGGWPLNVFVTPELEPVFGGTYFPGPGASTPTQATEDEQEDSGLLGILTKLRNVWRDQEDRCRQDASSILQQLRDYAADGTLGGRLGGGPSSLDIELLEESYSYYERTFDTENGGWGGAPKFPTPAILALLLRIPFYPQAVLDIIGADEVATAGQMAVTTLKAMARGAIHDQIGHGFARYSVTSDWSLPHFEKMLYDNAQLLDVYLDAFLSTSNPEILGAVYDIATYLTEDALAAPSGGFYSSEDADSYYRKGDAEKREGAFYVWSRREFDEILGSPAAPICATFWGVLKDGNVKPEHDVHDEMLNKNVLSIKTTPQAIAGQFGMKEKEVVDIIKESKDKLLRHRNAERVRPALDDKIIAGWNGIAIGALARTSRVLEGFDPESATKYMSAAKKAVAFIEKEMYDSKTKTLKRVWKDGAGETEAFADDYAFVIEGLIDMYEATFEEKYLELADTLQSTQISLFRDDPSSPTHTSGGFFSTQTNATHTILRLKDGMDTSEPSTNGISACNLYRLSSLLNDETYSSIATETINAFEAEVMQHPHLFSSFMPAIVASKLGVKGRITILPQGMDKEDRSTVEPSKGLASVVVLKEGVEKSWLRSRNSLLKDLPKTKDGKPRTLICEGGICKEEIDAEGLALGVIDLGLGGKGKGNERLVGGFPTSI